MERFLIDDIVGGHRSAFAKLYEIMFSPLCAFGQKYLNDSLLVEDFVQESFISFWNQRKDFTNLSAIKSYLYTCLKNSCLNYLKHQMVKRNNEQEVIQRFESDNFYQHAIIEEETFNKLYAEIKVLPESTQKVMLLALNGLKNPEIADELGVSVNTVKTLKKNAYGKLRQKLAPSLHRSLFFLLC